MNNCYIIAFFCISIYPTTGAVAVTGPENGVFKRGSKVTLTCSFDRDCNSVAWNYKDRPMYNIGVGFLGSFEHRSSIVNSTTPGSCTSLVTITDLKLEDSGTYSCAGITSDKTAFHKKAELVVVDYIDDKCSLPANKSVVENETVTITCKFSTSYNGSTPLELVIQRNDRIVMNSSKTLKSIKASVIAVPPVVPGYQCLLNVDFRNAPEDYARNTLQEKICGSANEVTVMFPVRNLKLDPDQTNYRARTSIHCTADGYPEPIILWKKFPGGIIVANGRELVVDVASDENTYQCYAENEIRRETYLLNSSSIKVADNSTSDSDSSGCSSGCIGGIVVGGCVVCCAATTSVVVYKKKNNSSDKKSLASAKSSQGPKSSQEMEPLAHVDIKPEDPKRKDGKIRGPPDGGFDPVDPSLEDHQKGSTPVPAPRRPPIDPPPAKPRRTPNNSVEMNEEVLYAALEKEDAPRKFEDKKPSQQSDTIYDFAQRA